MQESFGEQKALRWKIIKGWKLKSIKNSFSPIKHQKWPINNLHQTTRAITLYTIHKTQKMFIIWTLRVIIKSNPHNPKSLFFSTFMAHREKWQKEWKNKFFNEKNVRRKITLHIKRENKIVYLTVDHLSETVYTVGSLLMNISSSLKSILLTVH